MIMEEMNGNGDISRPVGGDHEQGRDREEEVNGDRSNFPTRMEEEERDEMPSESLQQRIKETARQLQEMGFSPEEVCEIH